MDLTPSGTPSAEPAPVFSRTRVRIPFSPGIRPSVFAATLVGLLFGACSQDDYQFDSDTVHWPASIREAYPVARGVAQDWAPDVFIQSVGGGFGVMDADGRAQNHSFQFHSRRKLQNLKVHLFAGIPWTQAETDVVTPPPIAVNFVLFENLTVDSDDVVPQSIDWAFEVNQAHPDSIPGGTDYSARLLSIPAWPERPLPQVGDSLAWRVDFLIEDTFSGAGGRTYFSVARFYFHPRTGERLGHPVVPVQPEVYPFPEGFP